MMIVRSIKRFVLLIIVSFFLDSCNNEKSINLFDHHVYIWQRVWTPSINSSILHSRSEFPVLHILVSEMELSGKIIDANPDYSFLVSNQCKIIPVFRINGRSPDSSWNTVISHIDTVINQVKKKNVSIQGIEIDYDCASSKLSDYAVVLHKIRQLIDSNVSLSITALPSWINEPNLPQVLIECNYSVLQVHSVSDPQNGIFNNKLAFNNIMQYNSITPVPFRVALPAYSSLIQFDESGKAVLVENEIVRTFRNRSNAKECEVDPVIVNNMIHKLNKKSLNKLKGYVWFRLPVIEDRRSWTLPTLLSVVNNERLYSHLKIISERKNGIFDLKLKNEGNIDAMISSIDVSAVNCSIEEPLSNFSIIKVQSALCFTLLSPLKIKAGHTIPVGWLKCDSIKEITIRESK